MCKIYDFEKARKKAENSSDLSTKKDSIRRKIVETAMEGVTHLALWEDTGDNSYFDKATKEYAKMRKLLEKLEK